MNTQYLIYALGKLLQRQGSGALGHALQEDSTQAGQRAKENNIFGKDETGAIWHRHEDLDILKKFCPEGYAMAKRHGHFIVGNSKEGSYIGIPGRFLIEDQPAGGKTGFRLWQPLRGGEEIYGSLETMGEEAEEYIYGYWIARLDPETLELSEA